MCVCVLTVQVHLMQGLPSGLNSSFSLYRRPSKIQPADREVQNLTHITHLHLVLYTLVQHSNTFLYTYQNYLVLENDTLTNWPMNQHWLRKQGHLQSESITFWKLEITLFL